MPNRRHRPHKANAILIILFLAAIFFSLNQLTGFSSADNWEFSRQITVETSQALVAEHVVFGIYKPVACSEGISVVHGLSNREIAFETTNDVIDEDGLCLETDVVFDNFETVSAEYTIYWGEAQPKTLEIQPVTQQQDFQIQQTNVTGCGTTINSAGTYLLNQSLTGTTACITITASNVVLDCQGFSMTKTSGVGIPGVNISGATNVTVKNCILSSWDRGIFLTSSATGNRIENNTFSSNFVAMQPESNSGSNTIVNNRAISNSNGIIIDSSNNNLTGNNATLNGDAGIRLQSSASNNIISNNNASRNLASSAVGIRVASSSNNNKIENNIVNSNNDAGIYIQSSTGNNITNNTVTSNSVNGITLFSTANSNQVANNNATSNGNIGILLSSSANSNTISNNTADSNTVDGIEIFESNDNIISGNVANRNGQRGIALFTANNNVVTNNTARNNTIWDFFSTSSSTNNTVTDLEIGTTIISFTGKDIALRNGTSPGGEPLTSIGKYINATNNSADSFLFLNVSYTDSEVSGVNESSLRIAKNNASGWFTDPSAFSNTNDVDTTNNYVFANITNFGSTFAPLGTAAVTPTNISSCTNITASGSYVLNQSISGVQSGRSMCIDMQAGSVTFNCQNFNMDHTDVSSTSGIAANAITGIVIQNCNITDYGSGINFTNVNNSIIKDTNSTSNFANGIVLQMSHINLINNTRTGFSSVGANLGIKLNLSSSNNITYNVANSNSGTGIELQASHNNTMSRNDAHSNTDAGIFLFNSHSNNVTDNNLSANQDEGVILQNANNTYIMGNILSLGTVSDGVELITSFNNTISNNAIDQNAASGIRLFDSSRNTIANNSMQRNRFGHGISLESSSNGNVIANNTIDSNTNSGFAVLSTGVSLSASSNNTFINNSARNNTVWAFYSASSSLNNTATDLNLGDVVVSFESRDVALRNASSPAADPTSFINISKYVNATNNSATSFLFLNVSYTDAEVSSAGISESTLRIAKHNGSWFTNASVFSNTNGVDTANNVVFANVTNFGSTFAPLGTAAVAPTNISNCTNITISGSYVLNQSISNSGGATCIDITADNVAFDCAGFSVDGADVLLSSGIKATSGTNITIENCIVTDWFFGIILSSTNSGLIHNNTATSNTGVGIILDLGSKDNNITSNTASNNGPSVGIGIRMYTAHNNTITNNVADSNSGPGLTTEEFSTGNNFTSNVATNNQKGIAIIDSTNNRVLNNIINTSSLYGIRVSESDNIIDGNNITFNDIYGIIIDLADNNNITNNNVNSNPGTGIGINSASSNNIIANNTVQNNTIWDFESISALATTNVISDMDIGGPVISFMADRISLRNGTSPSGEPLTSIGKYINATNNSAGSWLYLNVSYTNAEASGVVESSLQMAKHNGSWITAPTAFASSSGVDTTNNVVFANITNFGSTFAPLGTAAAVTNITSCTNITTGDSYFLSQNISGTGTCIGILASNVSLNCGGFSITYGTSGAGYGINVTAANNVTIQNCTIVKGSDIGTNNYGINLDSVLNSSIASNTIRTNGTNSNHGIILSLANFTNITSNRIFANGSSIANRGIFFSLSSNNITIRLNSIATNGTADNSGIQIDFGSSNTIENNTIFASGTSSSNKGIFASTASLNVIRMNNITTSGTGDNHGIHFRSAAPNNNASSNIINAINGTGIHIEHVNNSAISNTITANGTNSHHGIHLRSGGSGNVTANTIVSTNGTGIAFDTANNNVSNNEIISAITGISFSGATANNTLINNTIRNATRFVSDASTTAPRSNVFINTTLGNVSAAIVSFLGDNYRMSNASIIPADPASFVNISSYLNLTNLTATATLFLNWSYAPSADVIDENTTAIAKFNESSGEWVANMSLFSVISGINAAENYVFANITAFDNPFAVLAQPLPEEEEAGAAEAEALGGPAVLVEPETFEIELQPGESQEFELDFGDALEFQIGDEEHSIRLTGIFDDTAELEFSSHTFRDTFGVGETKAYDLTENNVTDIEVGLISKSENSIRLSIKALEEVITVTPPPPPPPEAEAFFGLPSAFFFAPLVGTTEGQAVIALIIIAAAGAAAFGILRTAKTRRRRAVAVAVPIVKPVPYKVIEAYIARETERKHYAGHIIENLLKKGWRYEDVRKAYERVRRKQTGEKELPPLPPKLPSKPIPPPVPVAKPTMEARKPIKVKREWKFTKNIRRKRLAQEYLEMETSKGHYPKHAMENLRKMGYAESEIRKHYEKVRKRQVKRRIKLIKRQDKR